MSKAENISTTPQISLHSRRDLLAKSGPALAAGLVVGSVPTGTLAAGSFEPAQWSPEFLEVRRLRNLFMQAETDATADPLYVEMWTAIDNMLARPVRTWQDVIELAALIREYCFGEGERRGEHQSVIDDLDDALLTAIETMASQQALA